MTDQFYQRWVAAAKELRPRQIPPTKDQLEWLLSILTEEQQRMILGQFDGDGDAKTGCADDQDFGEFDAGDLAEAMEEFCVERRIRRPDATRTDTKEDLTGNEQIEYLVEALIAARDVLVSLTKTLGLVPGQNAYSTRMTESEMIAARAIDDLDSIIRRSRPDATRTDGEVGP